jgi:hypothetical protein
MGGMDGGVPGCCIYRRDREREVGGCRREISENGKDVCIIY